MAHAVKSAVWTYFDILEDDNTKAMCKVCQEKGSRIVISRGGKTCKTIHHDKPAQSPL
jgi:hypothetical protein